MNIFIVPSWYPSDDHPLTGIFFKEQAQIFANLHPDINIGISIWGQNDERLLLWMKNPISNISKIINREKIKSSQCELLPNCTEFFSPTFTWSRKLFKGNISSIQKATEKNLSLFENKYGKIDLILAHVGYSAGYIAFLMSEKYKIPYVIVEHMSPFPFKAYLNRKGEWIDELKLAYKNASRIIAVSHKLKTRLLDLKFNRAICIYNFLDDEEFITKRTRDVDEIDIMTIGRIAEQKGIDVLIRAIGNVTNKILKFEIGGDGPLKRKYQLLAKNLGIEKKVRWKGEISRNDIVNEFQKCSLFVLPSRHENMPLVLLEALACGKPCIVTECGGPEEIITDEVGIVVEKENPEALAQAIDYMANNLDKYPAERIRKYFEANFSAQKITNQFRSVFEEVIKNYKIS